MPPLDFSEHYASTVPVDSLATPPSDSTARAAQDRTSVRMTDLLTTGQFSDFNITTSTTNVVFKVHRMVLCTSSPFFSRVCYEPDSPTLSHTPPPHSRATSHHEPSLSSLSISSPTSTTSTSKPPPAYTLDQATQTLTLLPPHNDIDVLRSVLSWLYDQSSPYTSSLLKSNSESRHVLPEVLSFHLEVYLLSLLFEVPSLSSLSAATLQSYALPLSHAALSPRHYLPAVRQLLTQTPSTDTLARPVVLRFCARFRDHPDFQAVDELMMEVEPMAWTAVKGVYGDVDEAISGHDGLVERYQGLKERHEIARRACSRHDTFRRECFIGALQKYSGGRGKAVGWTCGTCGAEC